MQLTISILIFSSLASLIVALQKQAQTGKVDLQGRLKNVIAQDETNNIRQAELNKPLTERLAHPLLIIFSSLAARLLPAEILQTLEKKVQRAGRPGGFTARDYLGMKIIFSLGLPMIFYLMNRSNMEAKTMGMIALAAVVGWRFPEIKLDNLAKTRMKLMEKTFPDVLDLLTVSVEAGLGFDGAMAKVVEKSDGPVAEEFRRVLNEIRMGKARREALRDFADRCGNDDIKSFTGAIVQSDQLGLNIGKTLKNQAELMRRKRRQRVEEKAMKVPVKMLIPMVVFIFPTIFIVLLGPAVIQVLENFMVM